MINKTLLIIAVGMLLITSCNNNQQLNDKVTVLQDSLTSLRAIVMQLKRSDSLSYINIVNQREEIRSLSEKIKHISSIVKNVLMILK